MKSYTHTKYTSTSPTWHYNVNGIDVVGAKVQKVTYLKHETITILGIARDHISNNKLYDF